MADDEEKEKSANQILQAFDALSQTLHKARATRRTASLPLPRSVKDADDVVDDAAEDEAARPQHRRRLSPMSPLRSRPKLLHRKEDDDGDGDEEEEGADDESEPPKRQPQEFTAVKPEDVMVEKKGVTSWGATRVLSHIGMRRFGCVFSVEVVSAQGAPPSMNGLRLAVNVRKKEKRDGDAGDFDEALYVRCSLYGSGAGAGGATGTNKPVEPARSPFLLSVAVDGPEVVPELARRRSTVDLSQFAMEFTEKGQQWDMVFPLATAGGKQAKGGGDLFVKLVFQSAGDDGTYSQLAGEGKTFSSSALSSFARKLRKSSLTNMLTPKMTRTKTPKLDEAEPVAAEVKEKQQEEPEPVVEVKEEPQEEPEPVVEVKEEPQEEPADEPAEAAEVKEEEQKEPEPDAQDDDTELPVFDVQGQEEDDIKEQVDEAKQESEEASVVTGDEMAKEEANELETKVLEEATPIHVSDAVADAVEPVESEATGSEEVSVANELEIEADEVATSSDVSNTVAEAVEPVEAEAEGSKEVSVVVGNEVANELETEAVEVATPNDVSDTVANAVEPVEVEAAGSEEVSVVAGDEVANELETEAIEVATANHVSDTDADAVEPVDVEAAESEEASAVASDEVANDIETEAVTVATPNDVSDTITNATELVDAEAAESEVADNEVAKDVANELDAEALESATANDMSDAVTKAVEAEAAGPEEVNGEYMQVPEQQEDKSEATKPRRRRRFGWRMLALVVTPVAVLVSKNLNVVRF